MAESLLSDEERFVAEQLQHTEDALKIIYTSAVLKKAKQLYGDDGHVNSLLNASNEDIVRYCNRAEILLKIEEQDRISKE